MHLTLETKLGLNKRCIYKGNSKDFSAVQVQPFGWASEVQKLQRFVRLFGFGHSGDFQRMEKTKFCLASQVRVQVDFCLSKEQKKLKIQSVSSEEWKKPRFFSELLKNNRKPRFVSKVSGSLEKVEPRFVKKTKDSFGGFPKDQDL
ncbi:hypothetical protein GLOIN_2v1779851 [Rhizophagus irregularis DAOM 181602=DAOM 197198]|nr:hypothetical protein GLOIN_2v1779851 [Rhizophagus irregularis DAOM 181602=DAOM 197198]